MANDDSTQMTVTYAIDDQDRLMAVNESWLIFAEANEAGHTLRPDDVVGVSLWEFIREPTLRKIYQQLVILVRESQRRIEFEFRCDSPKFRRYMQMTMLPQSSGSVQFLSKTLKVEQRDNSPLLNSVFPGVHHIQQCSICNLYQSPEGEWLELDEILNRFASLNSDRSAKILWSVCRPCHDRLISIGS